MWNIDLKCNEIPGVAIAATFIDSVIAIHFKLDTGMGVPWVRNGLWM